MFDRPAAGAPPGALVRERFRSLLRWILPALVALLAACNSDSRQLAERAEARWRVGNYEDAIRLNTLLYERDPEGKYAAPACLNIGNIYYLNLRQIKNAVDEYKKLIEEQPESPEASKAREQLATIYENELNDLTQAIAQYDKLLEAPHPENRADILFKRANAYFNLEDYNRAWRELRLIEDSGEGGTHLLDQVRLKLGNIDQIRRQYSDAADYFKKVLTSPCPECRHRAILNLCETYEALLDFDRAIETIRMLDHTPEDEKLTAQEVARLTEKKQRMASGASLNWNYPHQTPPKVTPKARSTQQSSKK
jgi:tetratricopeptide (TPR) repeat protein